MKIRKNPIFWNRANTLTKENRMGAGASAQFFILEVHSSLFFFFLQRAKRNITDKFKYVGIGDEIVPWNRAWLGFACIQ